MSLSLAAAAAAAAASSSSGQQQQRRQGSDNGGQQQQRRWQLAAPEVPQDQILELRQVHDVWPLIMCGVTQIFWPGVAIRGLRLNSAHSAQVQAS